MIANGILETDIEQFGGLFDLPFSGRLNQIVLIKRPWAY